MKKTLAILLALACLLGCTGCSNKDADSKGSADEKILSFVGRYYGEPQTLSYSVAKEELGLDVANEYMTFIVYDEGFACEYYASDNTAHIWVQDGAPSDSVKKGLELAKALLKDYDAFYLGFSFADSNGGQAVLLNPKLAKPDPNGGFFNDYDAFEDKAMTLYESLYPAKAR